MSNEQDKPAQIFPIMKHLVEGAILELRLMTERILHQLEVRHAVFVQGDKFAAEGVRGHHVGVSSKHPSKPA